MKKIRILSLLLSLLLLLSLVSGAVFATQDEQTETAETAETAEETLPPSDPDEFRSYSASGTPEFSVDCGAALLLELNSGTVIFAHNAEEIVYPASLTKIMTTMLALQYGKPDDVLTVSETALEGLDEAGSTADLQVGEQMKLRDMLYCIMLSSANEACNVVAEYISSDIDSFVALMNKTAKELGCTNTHFANAHGLHESDHYTTARDLSIITRKALTNEDFREICATANYTVPATNLSEERKLVTTNYLISSQIVTDYYYPDAVGIKTGYTSAAGRCVISRAANGNLNLLAIVLGASTEILDDGGIRYNNFIEARRLFEYGFGNFSYAQVLTRLQPTAQVPVRFSKDDKGVVLIPSKDINAILPKEYDKTLITTKYKLDSPDGLVAPLEQGEQVGSVRVFYDGREVGETTIETLTAVEVSGATKVFEESKDFIHEYWWFVALLGGLIALLLLFLLLRTIIHRHRRRRSMRRRRPGGTGR